MYRRPYIESSAFIAFIRGENRGDDHDCKAVMDSILQAAEDGYFRIFTSSLTIAEVFKNKKHGVELTEQENEDLKPYFRSEYIVIIEVDRDIGERANELCRSHNAGPDLPPLRPNDAIHLACAERASCEILLAYDADLTKQTHPDIDIRWPELIVRVAMPGYLALGAGAPPIQQMLALNAPEEVQEEPALTVASVTSEESQRSRDQEQDELATEPRYTDSQLLEQPPAEVSIKTGLAAVPRDSVQTPVCDEQETAVDLGDKEKGADAFKAPAPSTLSS